jgi:hypothetical protein
MFMFEVRDIAWWYWLVTASFLTYGITGHPAGFLAAIFLTIVHLVHFIIREGNVTAFPVQVRYWYLLLLLQAYYEPLRMIYWIPMIGTWAQIIFGYCTMARCVSLLPWNRNEPFSSKLVNKTFFSRPVRGSVKQGFAAEH